MPNTTATVATFERDSTIFRAEHALRDSYTPNRLLEREREYSKYVQALTSIANASVPQNVFVYGDTGVGKTVATELILEELKRDTAQFDDVDVGTIWINCTDRTSYQVVTELVNEFRSPGEEISGVGHTPSQVYGFLWDAIEASPYTHVVFVLDEVDSLGTDDTLLYKLPRARADGDIASTHVGLIGICNNFRFHEDLSARVESTLCEYEIRFGPYDASELKTILRDRADTAFHDSALEPGAVGLAAALAGQDTGSARHALDILHKAGVLAREHDAENVTEEHVREAEGLVAQTVVVDELRDLPAHARQSMLALTRLARRGETPADRSRIHEVYCTLCERAGMDAKTKRTVLDKLSTLSLKGFVETHEENTGARGGRRYLYDLEVGVETVHSALDVRSQSSVGAEGDDE